MSGKYISSHSTTANLFLGSWANRAAIPAGMLAPDSLVLTPSPAKSRRMFAKFLVDVVLPLVPDTKTMSRPALNLDIAPGSSARITRPLRVSPRPRPSFIDSRPDNSPALQAVASLSLLNTNDLALIT